ncbi:MAG: hypothetical protein QM723_02650 [Myxococcaceae bacterium]
MPIVPGTRADVLIAGVYALQCIVPFIVWRSFRFARRRSFATHRRIQLSLLAFCTAAVVLLEARIRLAGGTGVLTAASTFAGSTAFRIIFGVHITGAVLTYALWGWLAFVSNRRFSQTLPGAFSARHRRLGKTIFGGLCFTVLSATAMFFLGFVF